MRKLSKEEKRCLEDVITMIMSCAVSGDYARHILNHAVKDENGELIGNTFMDDVIEDVMCASAWEEDGCYNDNDICFSIGRILMERLDIEEV